MEKLSSMKPVPGAKMVGDRCCKALTSKMYKQLTQLYVKKKKKQTTQSKNEQEI